MDELSEQLRRYADAAAARTSDAPVPLSAPAAQPKRSLGARRTWLAAAAAVVLVVGAAGVVVLGDDGEGVQSTPAGPGGAECATPRSDGARIGDLTMALPWVSSADRQLATEDRLLIVLDRNGPREVQVQISDLGPVGGGDPASGPADGFGATTVTVCDPFGDGSRTELPATVIEPFTSVFFHLGERWTVELFVPDESELDLEDLRAIAAGMSWPDPGDSEGPCREAGTGSLTITTLPDDFQPESPEQAWVLDPSVTDSVVQHFRRSDGARIDVIWFAAPDPAQVLTALRGDVAGPGVDGESRPEADRTLVTGCVPEAGRWVHGPVETLVQLGSQHVLAAARTGAEQGWVVIGSNGTDRAEVLEVAAGLRP